MTHLHMQVEVATIRAYDEPNGYAQRLPYKGIMTVTFLTPTTVYLHGAIGTMTREIRQQGLSMLKERGVTTVLVERHGKMKEFLI